MIRPLLTLALSFLLVVSLGAQAGPKEDFEKAYSEAESTHEEAGTFQWTTTADRLKAAREAADADDYGKAATLANEALELANQSMAQQQKQQEAWHKVAIGD